MDFKEFKNFLSANDSTEHADLKNKIFNLVERDYHIRFLPFLFKVIPLHLLAGTLTLLICPQFGLGLGNLGLSKIYYQLHQYPILCAIYCGVIFFGLASFLPFLFLNLNELQYYRKKVHTFFALWGSLAFSSFMLLGNQATLTFTLIWLTAGFCFTIFSLNSAVFLKTRSA
jgi:hypothetical protein